MAKDLGEELQDKESSKFKDHKTLIQKRIAIISH